MPTKKRATRKASKVQTGPFLIGTSASKKELYAALGIRESATPNEIHAAFVLIAKANHPDHHNGAVLPVFAAAQRAHDILMDPIRRAQYDATGSFDASGKSDHGQAMGMIQKHIHAIMIDGVDPNEVNILRRCKESLERDIQDADVMILTLQKTIEKVERQRDAIALRWKGAEAVKASLLAMIDGGLQIDRAKLAPHYEAKRYAKIALEMLALASYDVPDSGRMYHPGPNMGTSFSMSDFFRNAGYAR